MPFEIWQHRVSGERDLVVAHRGRAEVAAGPLYPGEDPAIVLATHGNQRHNAWVLLEMRRQPEDYRRGLVLDATGHVVRVPDTETTATD